MIPLHMEMVIISTQHGEEISMKELWKEILEKIVKNIISKKLIDNWVIYCVQDQLIFSI